MALSREGDDDNLSYEGDDDDKSKVNLLDLAASCLASAIVAADQITALAGTTTTSTSSDSGVGANDIKEENKKNARLKIDGSFVTDADMAAQQIIVDALHKVSSGIRIVGEENEEEMRSRAITGHEKRLEAIFRLARDEIEIRLERAHGIRRHSIHSSGGGDGDDDDDDLPLAQRRKSNDENGEFEVKEQRNQSHLAVGGEDSSHPEENQSFSTFDQALATRIREIKERKIHTNRVSVFIDPLDATNSYAKGHHDPVSILVAIIVDQIPYFGVICKPFGYPERSSVLDTGCVAVYGGHLLDGAYIAGGCAIDRSKRGMTKPAKDLLDCIHRDRKDLPRAVISKSRSKGIVQDFVTHLGERGIIHPEPLLVSGAGEKSLRIIAGFENEGLWFYPKGGTSLWDVAASDAILRAIGGRLTDKNGNDMDYSKPRKDAENKDGVVACYDEELHADCIRLFLEGSWEDS
jgi:3'-phosphoadenosine 5'-phosphosulfate (PAPS) 3'-phosphatase